MLWMAAAAGMKVREGQNPYSLLSSLYSSCVSHILCIKLRRNLSCLSCTCAAAGGDEGANVYRDRLQSVCERYETVVMLGDSMGASAALLFAPLATAVLAFCPQVTHHERNQQGLSFAMIDV